MHELERIFKLLHFLFLFLLFTFSLCIFHGLFLIRFIRLFLIVMLSNSLCFFPLPYVLFNLLVPLHLMRGKRSHAEFSPLRVVNFPHVLHVLSMFVVVVLSIFMFALLIVHVTLLRCSSEGHVLEDDAHAHDCEEVGVGGVLA